MANRHARLLREQQAAERLALERQAFQRSKSAQKQFRSVARIRTELTREATPADTLPLDVLLRRGAVRRCLVSSPGFYLVLQNFLESGAPVRHLSTWRTPRSAEPARMFRSLARHAMLRYAMPEPLLRAIADTLAVGARADARTIGWFVHVARGGNLSKADDLPFGFTKKAAHFFLHAPQTMTLPVAMRWAQVRALGMQEHLAAALAEVLQNEAPENEAIWSDFICFILRNQSALTPEEIPGMVLFVRNQRLEPFVLSLGGFRESIEPLYPALQIGQATLASLRERMNTWDQHLQALERAVRWRKFPASPIPEYFSTCINGQEFRIMRLCSVEKLLLEGVAMHHCVGGYGEECNTGDTSIWSLRRVGATGQAEREATIELTAALDIFQVKGKANTHPKADAMQAVEQWAKCHNLQFCSW
jgi:hypothetical protein